MSKEEFNPDAWLSAADEDNNSVLEAIQQPVNNTSTFRYNEKSEDDDKEDDGKEDEVDLKADWDLEGTEAKEEEAPMLSEEEEAQKLKEINETLDTSYTTLEEAKAAVKGEKKEEKPAEEEAPKFTEGRFLEEEEQKQLDTIRTLKALPPEELMRKQVEQDMLDAIKLNLRTDGYTQREDGEIILDKEEVQFELDELKGNVSEYQKKYKDLIGKFSNFEKQLTDKETANKQAAEKKVAENAKRMRAEVQEHLKKMTNFMGVEINPRLLQQAYKNVSSGKFFDEFLSDNKNVAELALFALAKDNINTQLQEKGYGKGRVDTFQTIEEARNSEQGIHLSEKGKKTGGFSPDAWSRSGIEE